jgi:hypothetical protein
LRPVVEGHRAPRRLYDLDLGEEHVQERLRIVERFERLKIGAVR